MSRRRPAAHHGLLLIDKPAGPTSHDLVQSARRLLGQSQVGHTGTLDPPATGLLPFVLGRATRLARFLPHSPKTYVGLLRLGWTSPSDDAAGTLERGPAAAPADPGLVLDQARRMIGEVDQLPPRVSAKQVDGQRLHALARAGIEIERSPCRVRIHRFELSATDDPERFEYLAEVSAGTYVRAMARDLGQALGCGGLIETLRRTAIGPYAVAEAVRWSVPGEKLDPAHVRAAIVPPERLVLAMTAVRLASPPAAARFVAGSAVEESEFDPDPARGGDPPPEFTALRRVADDGGRLLGVGELVGSALCPRVVIAGTPADGTRQVAEKE